jgi:phage terminase large subunit-like protein
MIDADGQPARLGSKLDPWQRDDFQALDPGWKRVAGQGGDGPARAWLERPRGHSKTLDLAVMATWTLFASRKMLRGYGAAADLDQAKLLRDAIDGLLRLNPWLSAILRADRLKVANERTGSTLEILTSDAPTSYGLTPDFLVCDEVVHWRSRDLWDSLISSAAKRRDCMVVVISNAGFADSWQWSLREAVRSDPAWLFSCFDGPCASWITPDRLAEQRRLLPTIAYRRLWENEWSTGSGDALAPEDIDVAMVLKGPASGAKKGYVFYAGIDLGLSRDKAALCIIGRHVGWSERKPGPRRRLSAAAEAMFDLGIWERQDEEDEPNEYVEHPGTGRIKLARVQVWSPPRKGKIDLEQVEKAVVHFDKRFQLQAIGIDPWQAAYLVERLRKMNVPISPVDFTGNNLKSMCSATLEAFSEGMIDLYADPDLLHDLRSLRVVEKSYGVRLDSPRGLNGHGDAATALAIALHVAESRHAVFTGREADRIIAV